MDIPFTIWKQIQDSLRKITLDSDDLGAKELALDTLLVMTSSRGDKMVIEGVQLSTNIYDEIVKYMRQGKKIQAIKEFKEHGKTSLTDAKHIIERFSFTIKTPMINGYQEPNPD